MICRNFFCENWVTWTKHSEQPPTPVIRLWDMQNIEAGDSGSERLASSFCRKWNCASDWSAMTTSCDGVTGTSPLLKSSTPGFDVDSAVSALHRERSKSSESLTGVEQRERHDERGVSTPSDLDEIGQWREQAAWYKVVSHRWGVTGVNSHSSTWWKRTMKDKNIRQVSQS